MSVITAVSKATTILAHTATRIADANALRTNIMVGSQSSFFLGGSDVTETNGFPVAANQMVTIGADGAQAALYAISGSSTTINTLEFDPL